MNYLTDLFQDYCDGGTLDDRIREVAMVRQ